jgi:hypothetical protein
MNRHHGVVAVTTWTLTDQVDLPTASPHHHETVDTFLVVLAVYRHLSGDWRPAES